jgi:hypothetical protein
VTHNELETVPDSLPAGRSRWISPLTWSVLSLLALLVFELTAQPTLSAVVMCSKLGWENLLTGLWLRRVDPNRGRGAACFWFSLLVGTFKICMTAFGLSVVIIIAMNVSGEARPGPGGVHKGSSLFLSLFCLAIVTEVLLAFFGLPACIHAKRHKVKVWISPMLHRARRAGQWPPADPSDLDRANFGDVALLPATVMGVVGIAGGAANLIMDLKLPTIPVVAFALPAIVIVVWLSRGVTATKVTECWPEAATTHSEAD